MKRKLVESEMLIKRDNKLIPVNIEGLIYYVFDKCHNEDADGNRRTAQVMICNVNNVVSTDNVFDLSAEEEEEAKEVLENAFEL